MKKIIQTSVFAAVCALPFMLAPGNVTAGADPFIGEISYVGFNFAPKNWAQCDGQLLSISQNSALFSLLGIYYGGDGRSTFALPDMRGRVPVHQGAGFIMGAKFGAATVTLQAANTPIHTHPGTAVSTSTVHAVNAGGNANPGSTSFLARNASVLAKTYSTSTPDVTLHPGSIVTTTDVTVQNNTGGGQAFSIMQPYTVLNCVIALQGLYPPRN